MGVYDPILTTIGLLDGGKLTKKAGDKYFQEVTALLIRGNADGKGMPDVLTALFPIPPTDPTPPILNVTTLKPEKVFWFDPDPFAALQANHIKDRKNAEVLHAIFLDLLFEKTAIAMDLNGATPFAPILDYSSIFIDFPFPPKFPDDFLPKLPELGIKLPDLTIPVLMAKLGIKFPPPIPPFTIPFPPPGIPPKLPPIDLPIPPLILLDFCIKMLELPFLTLKKIVLPPKIDLALDIPSLPAVVFKIAFDIMLGIMVDLDLLLITPKLLISCLLVYLKNVVGMVVADIIGLLVGAGNLAKTGAVLCGLL